ncbi:hypothetical protein SH528x_007212 [Novipirellula sp. SH528]|uniref:hypothetical protein n=1 Tax=Novipirellula sp. SH528 TaxID=3454466 RepID=UPI003FA05ECB
MKHCIFVSVLSITFLTLLGCGTSETTQSTNTDEMKAYLEEHPELVIDMEDLDETPPQE